LKLKFESVVFFSISLKKLIMTNKKQIKKNIGNNLDIKSNNPDPTSVFSNYIKSNVINDESINFLDVKKDIGFENPLDLSVFGRFTSHAYNKGGLALEEEIVNLKKEISNLKPKILTAESDRDLYSKKMEELLAKQQSSHVLNRIHSFAAAKYLSSTQFRDKFKHGTECNAVIVSIDIRRSTDLMLKAKSPTKYSDFITKLSAKLSRIIIDNYGIFDKFTGDGILAFFPDFYSGEKAVLRALKAAEECHEVFTKHYNDNKNTFTVFLKNVGLGIGIDFGSVCIANTPSELTVVGKPVVYACRFSGAKAGDTLLNLEVFDHLNSNFKELVHDHEETEIFIKHEGEALAFKVILGSNLKFFKENHPWDIFSDD